MGIFNKRKTQTANVISQPFNITVYPSKFEMQISSPISSIVPIRKRMNGTNEQLYEISKKNMNIYYVKTENSKTIKIKSAIDEIIECYLPCDEYVSYV